jgi:hypothetical protein
LRRELLLALAIVVLILGYVAWGTSNVIRTWRAAPATPTAPVLAAAPSPAPVATGPATVVAPVVVATGVVATGVDTATAAATSVATPAVAMAATTAPLTVAVTPTLAATVTVPATDTLSSTLALAATALAPVTEPGAGQAAPATTPAATAPAAKAPTPTAVVESPATAAVPTLAAPSQPLTPAPVPAAGPRSSIPGLTYADISTKLSSAFGMTCSGPVTSDLQVWQCVGLSPSGNRLTAVINGLDASHIVSITGAVNQPGKADPVAANFLSFLAALPFQGSQATQAQDWVSQHLTGEGRAAIGGDSKTPPTMLSLSGTPDLRILEVYAPQPLATGG